MFDNTQASDLQQNHRYNIYDQTEYEKKPDFTAVLTTTVVGNHLIQIQLHQTFADFLLKYTCSIIVGI